MSDYRVTFCSALLLSFSHFFFFFNDTATTEIYTLSLHDALPIYSGRSGRTVVCGCCRRGAGHRLPADRKSTRLNSSHVAISYAVFCLKKKKMITSKPLAAKSWYSGNTDHIFFL